MGKVASGHAPGLSGAVFSRFHCARHESVSSGIHVARHEPKVLTFQIQQDVLRDGLVMMLASFPLSCRQITLGIVTRFSSSSIMDCEL